MEWGWGGRQELMLELGVTFLVHRFVHQLQTWPSFVVQGFYLRFYFVDMIDEVIDHVIELHLQSLRASWRVGVR